MRDGAAVLFSSQTSDISVKQQYAEFTLPLFWQILEPTLVYLLLFSLQSYMFI